MRYASVSLQRLSDLVVQKHGSRKVPCRSRASHLSEHRLGSAAITHCLLIELDLRWQTVLHVELAFGPVAFELAATVGHPRRPVLRGAQAIRLEERDHSSVALAEQLDPTGARRGLPECAHLVGHGL